MKLAAILSPGRNPKGDFEEARRLIIENELTNRGIAEASGISFERVKSLRITVRRGMKLI